MSTIKAMLLQDTWVVPDPISWELPPLQQIDAGAQFLTLLFYVAVIGLVILCIVGLLKPTKKRPPPTPPPRVESSKIDRPGFREPAQPREKEVLEPEPTRERIITERVLVICPYCGAKNEQGILKCRACGAEM